MLLVHSKRNLLQREEVLDHLNECLLAVAPDGALLFTNAPAKSIIGEGHLPAAFPLWPEVQNAFAEGASYSDLLTKWAKPLKQVGLFIGEDSHGLTIRVDDTGHGMTEQQIAADTGLSKVTVRRYLNYLIGTSKAESQVDYSTGGRPRVEYRSR